MLFESVDRINCNCKYIIGSDGIVGKGVHTLPPPPFSKIPPFLEIQDVPTFFRLIRKKKTLKDSFNRFVDNF